MTRIFHLFFMWMMDPMSGCDIRLVFTWPPRDSTLKYKTCIHLWNNFPWIITLVYPSMVHPSTLEEEGEYFAWFGEKIKVGNQNAIFFSFFDTLNLEIYLLSHKNNHFPYFSFSVPILPLTDLMTGFMFLFYL